MYSASACCNGDVDANVTYWWTRRSSADSSGGATQ